MPATASRIGLITSSLRYATAGPIESVETKYGDSARDTKEAIQTYFDNVEDAEILASERLALLSVDRRRFQQTVQGCETGISLGVEGLTPTIRLIDDERMADHNAAIVEIAIDFEKNQTTAVSWG